MAELIRYMDTSPLSEVPVACPPQYELKKDNKERIIMKKLKRILALIGVILLAALYVSTLVFALMDSPAAGGMFRASVAATILVPVLLYAYIMIARLLKERRQDEDDHSDA